MHDSITRPVSSTIVTIPNLHEAIVLGWARRWKEMDQGPSTDALRCTDPDGGEYEQQFDEDITSLIVHGIFLKGMGQEPNIKGCNNPQLQSDENPEKDSLGRTSAL